jgi:myo-inositol-1(or 4)-monophosphatase
MHGGGLAGTERVVCLAAPGSDDAVDRLVDIVQGHGLSLVLRDVGDSLGPDDWVPGATLGVTVGGDGTFLSGVQAFAPRSIPFLGVNTGTLGFLARIQPGDLSAALDAVFAGQATVAPRQRFRVTGPGFEATGINEVTIELPMPEDPVGRKVCRLAVETDREYLGEYEGTGLAVAAPTGATAMALSAGGPIQHPRGNHTLQVVPLHTNRLGQHPVVLDASRELRVATASPVRVLVDGGRPREYVDGGTVLTVTGEPEPAHIVETPSDRQFFEALGERLGWGGHNVSSVPDHPSGTRTPGSVQTRVRDTACDALRGAGDAIRRASDALDGDDAALADLRRRSERIITAHLSRQFPDHELRVDGSVVRPGDSPYTWFGTPLDGATNLARGSPQYAVGLALAESGEQPGTETNPLVSAVFAPATTDLVVFDGADTVRVDASAATDCADGTAVGPTARAGLDGCRSLTEGRPDLVEFAGFPERHGGTQRLGCPTLALTQVATGRADACWLAAATPAVLPAVWLVRGAGGRVTTPDGGPVSLADDTTQALVASNGPIHEPFRERIQQSL